MQNTSAKTNRIVRRHATELAGKYAEYAECAPACPACHAAWSGQHRCTTSAGAARNGSLGSGQAKSYDPQNPAVLESYAEYYRQTDQRDKAEKMLKETQDSKLLWRYYIKAGQYDEARKTLEQSYQANPKDISTLQGLLFLAEKAGDKAAATKYGEQLLSAEETPENHLLLVQTYLNLGLVKEAEQKLASFREKYPNDGKGILLGAWLSMKQGHLKEAIELINKRLESDQSDAIAWQLRGQINGMMMDYDQAIMRTSNEAKLCPM